VEGTITRDGNPVAGVSLSCVCKGYHTRGSTDETGSYRFEGLPVGQVHIDAAIPDEEKPGLWRGLTILEREIQAGETVRLDYELTAIE